MINQFFCILSEYPMLIFRISIQEKMPVLEIRKQAVSFLLSPLVG